jgi:hypothetical protein
MDPELLKLFMAQTKGGKKNVAGLLNTLDNPLFNIIAGVYDPVSAGAGNAGGALWSSYSNSQEPIIQDIVGKIEGGMDEFSLNSYIDALVAGGSDTAGFQVGDLKGLAKALQKEYSGTSSGYGGKQDVFSKAGLRNPLDVYSEEDAPLNARESNAYAEFLTRALESEKGMGAIESRIKSLRSQTQNTNKDLYADDMIGQGKKILGAGRGLGEDVFKSGDMIGQAKKMLASGGLGEKAFKSGDMIAMGKKVLAPSDIIGDAKSKTSSKKKSAPMSRNQWADMQRALVQRSDLDTVIQGDVARAGAIKKGGLARAQKSGRTPLLDQLAGAMKFLSGQSNA